MLVVYLLIAIVIMQVYSHPGFVVVFAAHAVIRKWVLLTDPDDKMAGVKVRGSCLMSIEILAAVTLDYRDVLIEH